MHACCKLHLEMAQAMRCSSFLLCVQVAVWCPSHPDDGISVYQLQEISCRRGVHECVAFTCALISHCKFITPQRGNSIYSTAHPPPQPYSEVSRRKFTRWRIPDFGGEETGVCDQVLLDPLVLVTTGVLCLAVYSFIQQSSLRLQCQLCYRVPEDPVAN